MPDSGQEQVLDIVVFIVLSLFCCRGGWGAGGSKHMSKDGHVLLSVWMHLGALL